MRRLRHGSAGFEAEWAEVCARRDESGGDDRTIDETAGRIVDDVARRGDAALVEHTARLDGWTPADAAALEVPASACEAAFDALDPALRGALEVAEARVRAYHERQMPLGWAGELSAGDGVVVGWRVTAMRRAGVYVPGGTAAYPSSVLMNVVPARVAGVDEVVMVSPAPRGDVLPVVLAAAHVAGVDRIYRVGGAQAIAALAFGTATVPACDVVVGPGNAWVAAAKRRVAGRVAVDMEAGPSEVLVVADSTADPEHVAADLLAQAEHDTRAVPGLICVADPALADAVERAVERRLRDLPRRAIALAAVADRGFVVEAPSIDVAARLANEFAPEHLEVVTEAPRQVLDRVRTAGAVFLGPWSPEALGDYAAGPNHVLPTAGTARFASPLGTWTFLRRTSVIEATAEGLEALADVVEALAEAEGLHAHAASVRIRRDR